MKKSFKKAGAAVLSMAMLLAIGASAMPVYAVNAPGAAGKSTNDSVNEGTGANATNGVGDKTLPGALYISLPENLLYRQGEGTDANGANGGVDQTVNNGEYRYDYIPGGTKITDAQINIYKVAELDGEDGWKWNGLSAQDITAIDAILTTPDAAGATTEATTFEKLLKKINSNGSEEFATKSEDLKKLASYLERLVANNAFGDAIATGTLNNGNQTLGFTLPEIDPALMTGGYTAENAPGTLNKIGYYLITTTTDQSGILVQPVLISLKNGQENPKNISLKGSVINIEKRITHVGTKDTDATPDGINDNHDDRIYDKGNTNETEGGKRATVGKKDIVHYEISAQLPKYDSGLATNTSGIEDFVIHDYAGNGLVIMPETVKAYVSLDDESKVSAASTTNNNWVLTGSNSTTPNTNDFNYHVQPDGHSMDLTITLKQMRGEQESTTKNDNTKNTGALTTMENAFIIVSFDAYVDGSSDTSSAAHHATTDADLAFDRSYVSPIVYGTDGTITYNPEVTPATGLNDVYSAWKLYVEKNDYTKGVEEAVLAAKAAGIYDSYISNATLQGIANGVSGMYAGYTTAETSKLLKNADGTKKTLTSEEIATEVAKEKTIALLLAIDHYNSTRNGETNYADMTYGNNYSTGGGKARDISNDTTVYSVDMRINKFVEKLTLAHKDTVTISDVTRAELDAAVAAMTTTPDVNAGAPTMEELNTQYTGLGLTDNGADNTKKYRQAAYELITSKQSALNNNMKYDQSWEKEAVKDAVFKLTDPDGEDTYIVSLGKDNAHPENDGLLVYLTENSYTDDVPDSEAVKYIDETNKKYYTLEAGAEAAEAMLQTGEYTLTEVHAPTGFKKWRDPVTITVSALDANGAVVTTNTKPDGAYQATGSSLTSTEIASQLTESGKGTVATPVTFKYYKDGTDNKASEGVLTHDIYNEYQDTLPATGGIGTVLFTAGGISVVLIAGALFVMYMKKKNAEDEE